MRCLLSHKWSMEKLLRFEPSALHARPSLYYRTCDRCGAVQRGIYDILLGGISWETLRERDRSRLEQINIVRQRSSRLDQLAHALNLRRSRLGDGEEVQKRSTMA